MGTGIATRLMCAAVPALLVCGLAAPAGAATVSVSGLAPNAQVVVVDGPGTFGDSEESWIAISQDGSSYRLEDGFEPLVAGAGCTGEPTQTVVTCPAAGVASVSLSLGPGDDIVESEIPIPTIANGGTGDDELSGGFDSGAGPVELHGGDGFDSLQGGPADDHLYGDDGEDDIAGSEGGDTVEGGAAADDIDGGTGNDAIDGGGANDTLEGGQGDDTIEGGTGDDVAAYETVAAGVTVATRPGVTVLPPQVTGGGGADTLTHIDGLIGGAHADTLTGDTGNNVIDGGPGSDAIAADAGADTIEAFDGDPDTVDCGPGTDSVHADQFDTLTGCEVKDVTQFVGAGQPLPTPVAAGGATAAPATASVSLRDARLVVRRGVVRVAISCAGARCAGSLMLKNGKLPVGHAQFSAAPGQTTTAAVKLSKAAKRKLARKGRLKAAATAVLSGGGTATARLTLTGKRTRR